MTPAASYLVVFFFHLQITANVILELYLRLNIIRFYEMSYLLQNKILASRTRRSKIAGLNMG